MSLESISEYVKKRYGGTMWNGAVTIVEGLPPLARIALAARLGRRALRLAVFPVPSAQRTVELVISAAEKAAGGLEISPQEIQAARDEVLLAAYKVEKDERPSGASSALGVVRQVVRCITFPPFVFGECTFLAILGLQTVVRWDGRERKLEETTIRAAINAEDEACRADLGRLIAYLEAAGEQWVDPQLDGEHRIPKLEGTLFDAIWGEDNCRRWKRIHTEMRRTGACFYPAHIFELTKMPESSRRAQL